MFDGIPDYNRSPDYWLSVARRRVEAAKAELADAEREFARLAAAIADRNERNVQHL